MSEIWFTIHPRGGKTVTGPVQGRGGLLDVVSGRQQACQLARLRQDCQRATEGCFLSVYKPAPGCCRVYPRYSRGGNGEPVDVPLAGATVEIAESGGAAHLAAAMDEVTGRKEAQP